MLHAHDGPTHLKTRVKNQYLPLLLFSLLSLESLGEREAHYITFTRLARELPESVCLLPTVLGLLEYAAMPIFQNNMAVKDSSLGPHACRARALTG